MTKLELNDKLAELYGLVGTHKYISGIDIIEGNIYSYYFLIDDWSRLMNLAVDNDIWVQSVKEMFVVYAHKRGTIEFEEVLFKDHESPQAATKFAIAMALVKLAEDK